MSALAVENEAFAKSVAQIEQISVKEIFADDKFNCRGRINPGDVVELSRDIGKHGLLQQITIQPWDKNPPYKFRVVMGHRRFVAVSLLKWDKIPASIVHGLNEVDALTENLVENLHRKDLNPLQEAFALKRFNDAGVTLEDMSRRLGKSKGWVQVRFTLLKLDPIIQQEVAAGLITQEQIKDIAALGTREAQFEAVKNIKDSKLRGEKRALKVKKVKRDVTKRQERHYHERLNMLGHVLDTIGPCVITRIFAWTNGEISTLDLYRNFKEYADEKGIHYAIPRETD